MHETDTHPCRRGSKRVNDLVALSSAAHDKGVDDTRQHTTTSSTPLFMSPFSGERLASSICQTSFIRSNQPLGMQCRVEQPTTHGIWPASFEPGVLLDVQPRVPATVFVQREKAHTSHIFLLVKKKYLAKKYRILTSHAASCSSC